jgi:hypothetical protein
MAERAGIRRGGFFVLYKTQRLTHENRWFYKKNTRRFELAACGRETSAAKAPGAFERSSHAPNMGPTR